jgi:hypothetical protein
LISIALLYFIAYLAMTIIAIVSGVNSADVIAPNTNELFLAMVTAKILQVIIFYILAKNKKDIQGKNFLSAKPMLIYFIVPFLSIMLIFFISSFVRNNFDVPDELILIVSISYLVINIIVFVLYEFINREAEKNYVLTAKQNQYEMTAQHNHEIEEIYENAKEWQNDYANHMELIMALLEKTETKDSNVDEALNYIKNLDEKITVTSLGIENFGGDI